jgi:hypothetical protein
MPFFAAKFNMARRLAIGAKVDPRIVRAPPINASSGSFKGSMLIVKGNIFAPDVKIGKYLKQMVSGGA